MIFHLLVTGSDQRVVEGHLVKRKQGSATSTCIYYITKSATLICSIIGSEYEVHEVPPMKFIRKFLPPFFQAGEYVDRADAQVAWSLPTSLFRSVVHCPAGRWDDGGSQTKYIGIRMKAENFTWKSWWTELNRLPRCVGGKQVGVGQEWIWCRCALRRLRRRSFLRRQFCLKRWTLDKYLPWNFFEVNHVKLWQGL